MATRSEFVFLWLRRWERPTTLETVDSKLDGVGADSLRVGYITFTYYTYCKINVLYGLIVLYYIAPVL